MGEAFWGWKMDVFFPHGLGVSWSCLCVCSHRCPMKSESSQFGLALPRAAASAFFSHAVTLPSANYNQMRTNNTIRVKAIKSSALQPSRPAYNNHADTPWSPRNNDMISKRSFILFHFPLTKNITPSL